MESNWIFGIFSLQLPAKYAGLKYKQDQRNLGAIITHPLANQKKSGNLKALTL